eukprot:g8877.t1
MILSKPTYKKSALKTPQKEDEELLSLDYYIKQRDWSGACTLLYCRHGSQLLKEPNSVAAKWKAFAHTHNGQFKEALEIYKKQTEATNDSEAFLHLAVCYYYMGLYEEALVAAQKGPETSLKTRLLMQIEDQQGNAELCEFHCSHLSNSVQDQLSLAALYIRHERHEDAIAIYKQILSQNERHFALEFYLAVSYSHLEIYDVALEHISAYLDKNPDSICGVNLKSCILYKLTGRSEAQNALQSVYDQCVSSSSSSFASNSMLTQHNMAVFTQGSNALEIWQSMKSTFPEALQNSIIWHLSHKSYMEAKKLSELSDPADTTSHVLKGLANMCIGQETESMELLRKGQDYLQSVGSSARHCDTVLGRQCIALCFMLSHQHEDALVYLESIREYVENDDAFIWNYGLSLAETGRFLEAQTQLEKIQNEEFRTERCFLEWLARCYIANGKVESAWSLYLQNKDAFHSISLLKLIANDCYITGAFLTSAHAFAALCGLEPSTENAAGKRGAIVGAFRAVATQQSPTEVVDELLQLSHQNCSETNETDRVVARALWNWVSNL